MRAGEVLVPQFAGKQVEKFSYTKTGAASDDQIDAIIWGNDHDQCGCQRCECRSALFSGKIKYDRRRCGKIEIRSQNRSI